MNHETAVYAGTFDPMTNGHLWMIEEGALLFKKLYVAIGKNASKQELFSVEERLKMLTLATSHIPNVEVCSFEKNEYLVHFAERMEAAYILRGVRNPSDFAYEQTLRLLNEDIHQKICTVFLMPPRTLAEVSSSTIKLLTGPDGWEEVVQKRVPAAVFEALKAKY